MNYSYLSQELHEPADLVYNFLKNIRAIRAIEVEMKIDDRVNFGPTFSGNSGLGYKVCVEVSNSIYPNTLEAFVADCITLGLPIKLYVAIPVQEGEKLDFNLIKRASRFGVGIVTIKNNKVEVLHEALELSLLVQCVDLKEYPKKNREEINNALNTYQNGNPVKGVATICDIIEGKIRKIGK